MLRFSIRELIGFSLATTLLIAWFAEHSRAGAANARAITAEREYDDLFSKSVRISSLIHNYGLTIVWSEGGPKEIIPIESFTETQQDSN